VFEAFPSRDRTMESLAGVHPLPTTKRVPNPTPHPSCSMNHIQPASAEPRILFAADSGASGGGQGWDDLKERVRDAIDIVDLVGGYIALRRSGKGLTGLCPWHDDSRPSLQVNPERQTFRCWVCNIGGDAFTFLMKMERLEFRQALEQLAERAGIPLPRGRGAGDADHRQPLLRVLAWAADRFRDCLRAGSESRAARDYLLRRGLTADTIDRFGLGFAPASWDWLLRQASAAGLSTAHLVEAGLIVERQDRSGHYDRFRDRVMFPIRDPLGRCVAFGGRVLPSSPGDAAKYINSPETPVFTKNAMLYGLDTAREAISRSRRAIVVEGYTDCLAARQAGIDDVVAVLGTALGQRHARLLRRYADRIVVVLDGDDAGRRRADEVLGVLLSEPVDVRIATLPAAADPCDVILAQGPEVFEEVVAAAVDPLDYRMEAAAARLPPDAGDEAALAAVESVLEALAAASPRSPLPPSQRQLREDQVIGRLARRFGLGRDALSRRLEALKSSTDTRAPAEQDGEPTRRIDLAALPAWDREVLTALIRDPTTAAVILREFRPVDLDTEPGQTALAAAHRLAASGRKICLAGLLLEIEDPALQAALVEVDEACATSTASDPNDHLVHLEEAVRRRTAQRQARLAARQLKTACAADDEAAILEKIVASQRAAQNIIPSITEAQAG
jgi:DNA primase